MPDIGLTAVLVTSCAILTAAALLVLLLRQARVRKIAWRRANPANDYAVRTRWAPSTTSTLNFSSFVYMDVDGDGKYGLADRPMAGIMVRLFDERGAFVKAARSNNGGFANFTMSTKRRRTALRVPGTLPVFGLRAAGLARQWCQREPVDTLARRARVPGRPRRR